MADVYFKCAACARRVVVEEDGVGLMLDCPGCGSAIEVPPPDLRFACPACRADMTAPASMQGETVVCQACREESWVPHLDEAAAPDELPAATREPGPAEDPAPAELLLEPIPAAAYDREPILEELEPVPEHELPPLNPAAAVGSADPAEAGTTLTPDLRPHPMRPVVEGTTIRQNLHKILHRDDDAPGGGAGAARMRGLTFLALAVIFILTGAAVTRQAGWGLLPLLTFGFALLLAILGLAELLARKR